ncbi:MAG: efflux transporter outer membrane subunit [Gammaproteobacteria bacterium]
MNKKLALRVGGLFMSAAMLFACARTPVPELELTDVPTDWINTVEADAEVWPSLDWWTNFDSEELTQIIDQVIENNLDLQNNERNLRAAQIQLQDAGFQLWPTPSISINTGASTFRTNFEDGTSTTGGGGDGFSLNGSVSYGGILSKPLNYERAVNDYESRLAQVYNTRLNTLGTAASTYFQLLFIRDQIEVANLNLENALTVGNFTEIRVESGIAVPLDLLQQQVTIEQQRNNLTSLLQREFQARASLSLLLGRRVEGFDVEAQTLEGITVPVVQPGIPSELLRRRPDLVQAEIALRNAAVSVDLARVNFFPQISLNGSAGSSSPALLGVIADPASTTVSLSASIAQTLLDNGSRRRNLEQTRLSLETALTNYRRSVLAAFNDIEVQLNNIELTALQGDVARRQLEAADESYRIAQLRYSQGVSTFDSLQLSQLQLFSARNNLLNNNLSQINNIISFYQSLGGGWEYLPITSEEIRAAKQAD